jgi:hypothetical protein
MKAVMRAASFSVRGVMTSSMAIPLGQKIEAIEGIVPARRSLVSRPSVIGSQIETNDTAKFQVTKLFRKMGTMMLVTRFALDAVAKSRPYRCLNARY